MICLTVQSLPKPLMTWELSDLVSHPEPLMGKEMINIKHTIARQIEKYLLSALYFFISLLPSIAIADASLTHNVGEIEMLVSDWGAFTKVEGGNIYPSFKYAGRNYLDPFSEIWAGNSSGQVASAYDIFEEGIILGEWQAIRPSGVVKYIQNGYTGDAQLTYAQYAPDRYNDYPFKIVIDQYSYSWNSAVYPDDGEFVIIKLVLTNLDRISLEDFYLAVQTNWDVDYNDEKDDMVDWDAGRRAGIAYDSDNTDPVYVALALISGKFASHNIVDVSSWYFLDTDRSILMSNGDIDDLNTILSKPGNYLNIISTGPYTIPPEGSVSAVFAFVAGRDRNELLGNIDAANRRAMLPDNLAANPSKEAIYLKWSEAINPDIAGYKVYKSTTSGSGYSEIAFLPAGNSSYSDNQTEMGTTYYYVVTAVGPDGIESAYSNEVKSTPGVAPSPPRNLTVRGDALAMPVLHWDPPSDEEITGYVVFRNLTGSEPWTAIATLDSSSLSFVDKNAYSGKTYYYVIAAVNTYNWNSEYSNAVSYKVNLSKSMAAAKDLNSVTAAPNPCNTQLTKKIRFINLTPSANIYIYTLAGELVKVIYHANGSGEEEWDMKNDAGTELASGIYLYYVESYKSKETGKLTSSGKFALIH